MTNTEITETLTSMTNRHIDAGTIDIVDGVITYAYNLNSLDSDTGWLTGYEYMSNVELF